jgi:uncharacterized membrane protein YgcG
MRPQPRTTFMNGLRRRMWRNLRLAALAAVVALAALAAFSFGAEPLAARALHRFLACPQQPVAGQRVYDCAGLLTPAETRELEARALAVQRAGGPVIVYLQVKSATFDQTLSDAASLMARWNVESKAGAKDGLVVLLNLKPGDIRHGQVALYAGRTLVNGALPQSELNRIFQDVVLPELAKGQTAQGIRAGLDALATDLRAGGPPGQSVARALGTIPYNVLAALLVLLALGLGLFSRWRARETMPALITTPTTAPPTDMPPAVAGALIAGKVAGQQMEATILDFARRGLLRIAPSGHHQASMQLLDDGGGLTGYERTLWQALEGQTAQERVIPQERMYKVAAQWRQALKELREILITREWFDAGASRKRWPLFAVTGLSAALAVIGVALGVAAREPWPFVGMGVCVTAGVVALIFALRVPNVTAEGQRAAQAARDYIAGLNVIGSDMDLNEALPYLVASGLGRAYGQRLQMVAERPGGAYVALYPYWIMLHHSMAPPASSGGVAGATGAAAGGSGAGGAF